MKKQDRPVIANKSSPDLFNGIVHLIEQSQRRVVASVNNEMTMLYWRVGKLISHNVLKNKRADYGEQIVATLSQQLTRAYGKGYTKSALSRMIGLYRSFSNEKIVATVSQQLSWSHFAELIAMADSLKRNFYMQLAIKENWGIREMRKRIESMLFERTSISKKPDKLIRQELRLLNTEGPVIPDLVFRDPYILDFLGLKDTFSENDLESAILNRLQ